MRAAPPLPGLEDDAPKKPAGGYRLIPVIQLVMAWWCYRVGLIRLPDLRAYFACHELVARRYLSTRAGLPACFNFEELQRLTGVSERQARASIARLQRAGLLQWAESALAFAESPDALNVPDLADFWAMVQKIKNRQRRVPIPRRILRLLAGGARPALIATILGHLLRCLYYRDGRCKGRGRCKASWIAATFGVAPRRVKQARVELIALGWLIPLDADQWALNRWGAHLRINLAWGRPAGIMSFPCPSTPVASPPETSLPVEAGPGPELAPPPADPGPELAPPDSDRQPLQELKYQKPTPGGPTGVCIHEANQEKTSPEPHPGSPTLRHVVKEDLQETDRLFELHYQAIAEGLVTPSERDRLRFVAAAEHARVIGTQNPCGLFVHLVRGKLYHFLTQDDEDTANVRIKRHLYGAPREGGGREPRPVLADRPKLSEDAVLVQAVQAALARVGYRGDPFRALRSQKPEWTRERWDRAVAEIKQTQFGQTSRGESEYRSSDL